jgi:hypothetical protein
MGVKEQVNLIRVHYLHEWKCHNEIPFCNKFVLIKMF